MTMLFFQQTVQTYPSEATGLEWMVVASVVVPAVLLAVLIYLGGKSAVRR